MSYGGLDIGTTSVKFVIYDENGRMLSMAQSGYGNNRQKEPNRLNGGKVLSAALQVIREANARAPKGDPLKALAVSSFGEAIVPVDGEGNDLAQAFLYTAREGAEELDDILSRADGAEIQRRTGVRPSVIFPPAKINWFRTHTQVFDRVWKFLQFEDYLIYHLTGSALISLSLASRSMALDLSREAWSDYVLEAAGIDPKLLSEPVPSGSCAGAIRRDIAGQLGLPDGVRVYTGGHDQMCGMIGTGAISPGSAANASGTVECISATLADSADRDRLLQSNVYVSAGMPRNRYYTFASTPAGCAILDWYKTLLNAPRDGHAPYTWLEGECSGQPSPVTVLPFMAGRGAPRRNIDATGAFLGLKLTTSRSDIWQAIMEALAFEMRIIMNLFGEAGMPVERIRATGGGAKSDLWLQLKADIYRRPVERMKSEQLSALGCALIAAVADGAYASLEEAAQRCVFRDRVFEPNLKNADRFDEKFEQYWKLWNAHSNGGQGGCL